MKEEFATTNALSNSPYLCFRDHGGFRSGTTKFQRSEETEGNRNQQVFSFFASKKTKWTLDRVDSQLYMLDERVNNSRNAEIDAPPINQRSRRYADDNLLPPVVSCLATVRMSAILFATVIYGQRF